jgi:hypothetical protein
MECREWADDMVHALTYCSLVIAPPVASPASSVRDTAETVPAAFTCPGLSMPQPADAPPEGYVACYRAGHTCTSTVTRTEDERGVATWVHCPCCGNSFSSMYMPAGMSEGGAE